MSIITAQIETEEGVFAAWFSARGLMQMEFPNGQKRPSSLLLETSPQLEQWRLITADALNAAVAGKQPKELPPLDLSAGAEFQQSVWNALRQIPIGETKSYAQMAEALGRPKAVRAVGQACGANPIPVLIPCHRVVAAGGKLGGFSSGLEWKRKLLSREADVVQAETVHVLFKNCSTRQSSAATVRSRGD